MGATRKRWFVRSIHWTLLLMAVSGILAIYWFAAPSPWKPRPFPEAEYQNLNTGMTEGDVIALLGPPGDFTTGSDAYEIGLEWSFGGWRSSDHVSADIIRHWIYDSWQIAAEFSAPGKKSFGGWDRYPLWPHDHRLRLFACEYQKSILVKRTFTKRCCDWLNDTWNLLLSRPIIHSF